jgi:hypothetical protein
MEIRFAFVVTNGIVLLHLSFSWALSWSQLSQSSSWRSRSLAVLSTRPESLRISQITQGRVLPLTSRLVAKREDASDDSDNTPHSHGLFERLNIRASSISVSLHSSWKRLRQSLTDTVYRKGWTPKNFILSSLKSVPEINVTDDTGELSELPLLPSGPRWAVSHPKIDLSGTWKPIITADFLKQYDEYLENCGTTYFFRQLCLKFCTMTRETITQLDNGRTLELFGKTPAGSWRRSLISSGGLI